MVMLWGQAVMNIGFRITRTISGCVLFGIGIALLLESNLGAGPWDIFHQGLAHHFDYYVYFGTYHIDIGSVGLISIIAGCTLLLVWPLLGETPGIGTVINMSITGITVDLVMWLVNEPTALLWRILFAVTAPVVIALGTVLYIGSGLGPGPRDGLMTGLVNKGVPVFIGRTTIELTVIIAGFLLGGTVGLGTIWFALTIGPLVDWFNRQLPFSTELLRVNSRSIER